jgi:hypothetical protein
LATVAGWSLRIRVHKFMNPPRIGQHHHETPLIAGRRRRPEHDTRAPNRLRGVANKCMGAEAHCLERSHRKDK